MKTYKFMAAAWLAVAVAFILWGSYKNYMDGFVEALGFYIIALIALIIVTIDIIYLREDY